MDFLNLPQAISANICDYLGTGDLARLATTCKSAYLFLKEIIKQRRAQKIIKEELSAVEKIYNDLDAVRSSYDKVKLIVNSCETLKRCFISTILVKPSVELLEQNNSTLHVILEHCDSKSTLLKQCSMELLKYCGIILQLSTSRKNKQNIVKEIVAAVYYQLESAIEGVYQSSEDLIVSATNALRELDAALSPEMIATFFKLLESKGTYLKTGAVKGFVSLRNMLDIPSVISQLVERLVGKQGNCIKEAAIILCEYGYEDKVKSGLLEVLEANSKSKRINGEQLKDVIEVIATRVNFLGKDTVSTERVVKSLVKSLELSDEDNWAKVDIITAIEKLKYFDTRLINALDFCLRMDGGGINTQGVRSAAIHALHSYGVPPNGRQCCEVLWVDKLRRGKSKILRIHAVCALVSLITFPILFFSLLYPEISSIKRAIETQGTVIDQQWQLTWGTCQSGDNVCYNLFLTVEYYVDNTSAVDAVASIVCDLTGDSSYEVCKQKYKINTTITIYYDPENYHVIFLNRKHESSDWRIRFFHTLFWPGLLLILPVCTLWPLLWYAWKQSRWERGKSVYCCNFFVQGQP